MVPGLQPDQTYLLPLHFAVFGRRQGARSRVFQQSRVPAQLQPLCAGREAGTQSCAPDAAAQPGCCKANLCSGSTVLRAAAGGVSCGTGCLGEGLGTRVNRCCLHTVCRTAPRWRMSCCRPGPTAQVRALFHPLALAQQQWHVPLCHHSAPSTALRSLSRCSHRCSHYSHPCRDPVIAMLSPPGFCSRRVCAGDAGGAGERAREPAAARLDRPHLWRQAAR